MLVTCKYFWFKFPVHVKFPTLCEPWYIKFPAPGRRFGVKFPGSAQGVMLKF